MAQKYPANAALKVLDGPLRLELPYKRIDRSARTKVQVFAVTNSGKEFGVVVGDFDKRRNQFDAQQTRILLEEFPPELPDIVRMPEDAFYEGWRIKNGVTRLKRPVQRSVLVQSERGLRELLRWYADPDQETHSSASTESSVFSREVSRQGEDWSDAEVELIVADYFDMLEAEAEGRPYIKAEHRRALRAKLDGRSDGSVEFKHQNISAVLVEAGLPYITGYKPYPNYQAKLAEAVHAFIEKHGQRSDRIFESFLEAPTSVATAAKASEIFVDAPTPLSMPAKCNGNGAPRGRHIDFALMDEANRKLGRAGEEFVLQAEKRRLLEAGRHDLANRVVWTSKDKGDGFGYDIESFDDRTDAPRHIEVKTTNSGAHSPFFLSSGEVEFAKQNVDSFCIYRVFSFKTRPQIFVLRGALESILDLRAASYRATLLSDPAGGPENE